MPLTFIPIPKIPLIKHGDNITEIILSCMQDAHLSIEDNDILVLAQKIVSKAEGRQVNLATITPSEKAIDLAKKSSKDPRLAELILRESREILRVRAGTVIVEHRLGFICASAGIDHSNVPMPQDQKPSGSYEDWVLLLPENPDRSALEIRRQLKLLTNHRLGVMIIDSHGRAWRQGVVGTCIGLSGLPGVVDARGKPDLYGYRLRITFIAAADELAAASSLVMGEAAEGTPVVLVRGFPFPLREGSLKELIRDKKTDLFR
jgi:coenzyme F420-0:L-glutamate ligase / coenzyme F420-1:gamma-L-glutamate ligase